MRPFLAVFFLVACGGDTNGTPGDGTSGGDGSGSQHIDAKSIDAALDDFFCGDINPCTQDQTCCFQPGNQSTPFACTAPSACPGADQLNCDGPDECGGATPICCGVDVPDGTGSFPSCGVQSLGTSCTSANACQTNLAQSCNETSKVVICHVKADCSADQNNPECCTFTNNGASLTFCTDSFTASLGGATCH
jgi:hypothetical protein